MAKKNLYHYRGHKIKNIGDIPKEEHHAVIVFNATSSENGIEYGNFDYYTFNQDQNDDLMNFINILYNENPNRSDIKIINSKPLDHKVQFSVQFELPLKNIAREKEFMERLEELPPVENKVNSEEENKEQENQEQENQE